MCVMSREGQKGYTEELHLGWEGQIRIYRWKDRKVYLKEMNSYIKAGENLRATER